VPSLAILPSAVLVLSCRQTESDADDCYSDVTTVDASNDDIYNVCRNELTNSYFSGRAPADNDTTSASFTSTHTAQRIRRLSAVTNSRACLGVNKSPKNIVIDKI